MKKTTGHIIRITGLVVEMLGVWGFYSSANAEDRTHLRLPGGTSVPIAGVAVVVGFILWLAGTIVVYTIRSQPKIRAADD